MARHSKSKDPREIVAARCEFILLIGSFRKLSGPLLHAGSGFGATFTGMILRYSSFTLSVGGKPVGMNRMPCPSSGSRRFAQRPSGVGFYFHASFR